MVGWLLAFLPVALAAAGPGWPPGADAGLRGEVVAIVGAQMVVIGGLLVAVIENRRRLRAAWLPVAEPLRRSREAARRRLR
jgi:hypothetical protein